MCSLGAKEVAAVDSCFALVRARQRCYSQALNKSRLKVSLERTFNLLLPPMKYRYLDEEGNTKKTSTFDTGCQHHLADKPGSFELLGDRVTKLGTNM